MRTDEDAAWPCRRLGLRPARIQHACLTDEHRVAARLPEHAADVRDVHHGVVEEHEVHGSGGRVGAQRRALRASRSIWQTLMALGSSFMLLTVAFYEAMLLSKSFDSAGSCLRMSSDAVKMDSRCIHWRCTVRASSMISDMLDSVFSQRVMGSLNVV